MRFRSAKHVNSLKTWEILNDLAENDLSSSLSSPKTLSYTWRVYNVVRFNKDMGRLSCLPKLAFFIQCRNMDMD